MTRPPDTPADATYLIGRAFAALTDALVISSPARTIVAANAAACAVFGTSEDALLGTPVRALYAIEADWLAAADALSNATPRTMAATLRSASAELFDAHVTVMPLHTADGTLSGCVETVQPIRATQSAPSAAPHDAHALRLARGLAHDFNNLLAIITGNVQLAQMRATDAKLARFLRDAEQACEMAAHMTHSVSAFARDRCIAPLAIDLAAFVAQRRSIFQAALAGRATLAVTIARDVPRAFADQSGLESALINLLGNARDAMSSDGSVTIDIRRATTQDGAAAVGIAVRDDGCGMTERVRARAFDPFFTTKPAGQGTGLGLASVYGFAQQAGGSADIDSAPGQGTTVRLTLPAAPES